MELSAQLFSVTWLWALAIGLLPVYWFAVRWADFARLQRDGVSGAYFGSIVVLLMIWALRTDLQPGMEWHLAGMVFMTLAWGWSLALLGGLLAQVGLAFAGIHDWTSIAPTLWVLVLLPAAVTQVVLGLVRAYLPKHFFVYVFVDAFFCGALVSALAALVSVGLLVTAGNAWTPLRDEVLPLIPLMLFPEAFLNGMIITMLVALRPQWVWSFHDEEYLSR
jgi:uncharacterized membrane protein